MKKTIFLAITLLLAISASAERKTIKDRTDNWLQRETIEETTEETTTSDNLRIGDAPVAPRVPAGEGLWLLCVCAGMYSMRIKKSK
ncbi:MAG: hypothetical protein LBS25_01280 [Candidatus Symbiothrix sp.]|nr:hypothetical protein [Candidatus Symbiothrix sp.]